MSSGLRIGLTAESPSEALDPPPTEALIAVRDLAVRYDGVTALCGINTRFRRGHITALIGPSGCGKTSLLHCLNRLSDLIPGCTVDGEIHIAGERITDPTVDVQKLRKRVGILFQQPTPFPTSIRRNIQLALREHGVRDREELAQVTERVLREVGLWDEVADRLDRPAPTLSGGQQQRLCLARALALKPEILLMDEPTNSLDPLSAAVVEDLIAALRGSYTVIMVTHNLAQARRLADDVAVFWIRGGGGRIVEQGRAERVFTAPRDADAAAYVTGRRG